MRLISYLFYFFLFFPTSSSIAEGLSSADIALVTRSLSIPRTWTISPKKSPWNAIHSNTYCTVFIASSRRKWLGNFCISSNENFRSEMGVRDEVPEEEDWADRSRYEVGYWSVTPLAIYPMTPFILKPIKNYAAESDCYLDDGPVYRATSMCHAAIYELRKGVFVYTVFHVFDNVRRKQKAQLSDIRNLWIRVGKKIKNLPNTK